MPSVEEAWNELRQRGVPGTLLRLDERHSANLYAAIDERSRLGLIALTDQELPAIGPFAALEVTIRKSQAANQLEIWLTDRDLETLFAALCEDLVSHSVAAIEQTSIAALIARLASWRRMLELGKRRLDQAALRGLVGELLMLEHLINVMPGAGVLQAWNGGFPASHDFALSDFHLEVKAVGPNANLVKITSLDQLDVHLDVKLLLGIAFIFEATEELVRGFTLTSLIARISERFEQIAAAQEFRVKLRSRGIVHPELYSDVWYRLDSLRFFKVTPQFPKITRATVAQGVISATYSLALSAIEPFEDLLERDP